MSENKIDKGRFFHKLHQLQKRVTRYLNLGKGDEAKALERREKKILEKIRGKKGNEPQD